MLQTVAVPELGIKDQIEYLYWGVGYHLSFFTYMIPVE